MATVSEQQVLSGHTAKIYIDGEEVGFVQDVSANVDTGVQAVFCLGSVEDQEHQQTHYQVRGNFRRYYVRDTMISDSKLGARSAASMIATGTFELLADSTVRMSLTVTETNDPATGATVATGSTKVSETTPQVQIAGDQLVLIYQPSSTDAGATPLSVVYQRFVCP